MKKFKRLISLVLAGTMALTSLTVTGVTAQAASGSGPISVWDFGCVEESDQELYTNYVTVDYLNNYAELGTNGQFAAAGEYAIEGSLTLNVNGNDRMYNPSSKTAGTYNSLNHSFSDGYSSSGGVYFNGTGGDTRRFIALNDVKAGSEIKAYVGSSNGSNLIVHFDYMGEGGEQKETTPELTEMSIVKFVAQYDGNYKLWFDAGSGAKPMATRVVKTPPIDVDLTVNKGDNQLPDTYKIKLLNNETENEQEVDVTSDKVSVELTPGYTYTATLVGATGYGFSLDSKRFEIKPEDLKSASKSVTLAVEPQITYTVSGKITGLSEGYNTDDLVVSFIPSDSSFETIKAAIDKTALTYSATLLAGISYTVSVEGACDYKLSEEITVSSEKDDVTKDVTFSAIPLNQVSGNFIGLTQMRGEYANLASVNPQALTFTNIEDKYVYNGTVSAGGYTVSLRDGIYLASITDDKYSTSTHVTVKGGEVTRDLLLKDEKPDSVEYKDTLTVGKDKDYQTVQAAVDAATAMERPNGERVTIKIDPGTYREQVVVNTPNITLESTSKNANDTKITWYYGIGYRYYSCVDSYYDPYADYDKFEKGDVISYWGSAVIINKTAEGFRAEGITFENSFNKYMTDEEISDGVEVNGLQAITVVRSKATDVTTKAATERAAALVNYADKLEAKDCRFLGSQDTLMTGNVATINSYYKNCYIEGQTDFIFGTGDVIFDGCEITFCGYNGSETAGYLTANSDGSNNNNAEDGYIFRSCYVSYGKELGGKTPATTPGYLGRMWGASAQVAFLNTQLENKDIIIPAGWSEMSGNKPDASTVVLAEYNTTYNGEKVDTSGRVNGVKSSIDDTKYTVKAVFVDKHGWTPAYYTTESSVAPEIAEGPAFTSNGDINIPAPGNTLTVNYTLNDECVNDDASRISYYAVAPGYDATSLDTILKSAELLYAGSAVSSVNYQIPMECAGKYIMAVVTPITYSGKTGTPKYVIAGQDGPVSDTWVDPSNPGSIAPGSGINIYLAGDSTVKDYSERGIYQGGKSTKEGSWGEFLFAFFNDKAVTVNNYAQGGRSLRSFLNEGSLDKIMANIKKGDYLFIQFGHNDCASEATYYVERFVPLFTSVDQVKDGVYPTVKPTDDMKSADGTYAWDCGATYKGYLQYYIDLALEKGATPVVISPVSRLYYQSDGTIRPHHDAASKGNAPTAALDTQNNAYVTACEQVYNENKDKGVLYIDAFDITKALYEQAYKDGGSDAYAKAIMNGGESTHSNKVGGVIQAGLLAQWIKNADLSISQYVIQPETLYGVMPDYSNIFEIENSKFTPNVPNIENADAINAYWAGIGQEIFDSLSGSVPVKDILGDVDGDGKITSNDAAGVYALMADANAAGLDASKADVDGKAGLSAEDASEIMQKVLRASHKFPAESAA